MTSDSGLYLGTSSWSSDDWVTAGFYPEGMAPTKYLPHYAQSFNTVEVDSTFYRLPTVGLCQKWRKDVPAGFRFALKVTKSITHDMALDGAEKEFEKYLQAVEELGDHLGFIVFQFAYFNRQSACPDLGTFIRRLAAFSKACPPRHNYVVEVRNKNWLTKDLFDALREHRFAYALTDQQWMPRPKPLWEKFGQDLITRDFAYVRFLGERDRIEKITTKWDKIVIDRSKEMEEWIPIFQELRKKDLSIFAYFNNHFSGYGPGSIAAFRKLWAEAFPS